MRPVGRKAMSSTGSQEKRLLEVEKAKHEVEEIKRFLFSIEEQMNEPRRSLSGVQADHKEALRKAALLKDQ